MKFLYSLLFVFFILAGCHLPESKNNTIESTPVKSQKESGIISIKTACILTEISYCDNPEVQLKKYLPDWKVVWKPEAVKGNYAFVATNGTLYTINIRGSLLEFSEAALNNWLYNDLNIAEQKDWEYADSNSHARISDGAYFGWENLNKLSDVSTGKKLWDFLQTISIDAPIVITGHSLGGNLATVYATYLFGEWKKAGQTRNNINVITFAAPAAGNEDFAESFDKQFPNSVRVENSNDIVPKFPVSNKVAGLGALFTPKPAASSISIGYKNLTVDLPKVFTLMSAAINLLRFTNNVSPYVQTNSNGTMITIPLSGKNNSDDASSWFAEAGYQHGMEQYAKAYDAPVIECKAQ